MNMRGNTTIWVMLPLILFMAAIVYSTSAFAVDEEYYYVETEYTDIPNSFNVYKGYVWSQDVCTNNRSISWTWKGTTGAGRKWNISTMKPDGTVYQTLSQTIYNGESPTIEYYQSACSCPGDELFDDVTGKCAPPPCVEEYDEAIIVCGSLENVTMISFETCEYTCTDCVTELERVQGECNYGYVMDNVSCKGRCKDCFDYYDDCTDDCKDRGGIQYQDCLYNSETGFDAVCNCQDGTTPEPLIPGIDPDPKPDDKTAEPDPTTPDPDKTDPYSPAIKKNLDTIVGQNNDRKNQLDTISKNLAAIADNQNLAEKNEKDARGVEDGLLTGIKKSIDDMTDALGDLKPAAETTDGTPPAVPEFNTDLDLTKSYDEYDDYEESAGDKVTDFETKFDAMMLGNESPIETSITATGQACLDGTVTIHGQPKQLSICFNRPWMLQGYAIMRVMLIAIGYLQVAMMLNRAVLA